MLYHDLGVSGGSVRKISFEEIAHGFEDKEGFKKLNCEHNYHKSYRCFVNYFKRLDSITVDDFVIAANFTYGWMPTILNFKPDRDSKELKFDRVVGLLNDARKRRLSAEEVLEVKTLVNNSIVGTSKLLHFINPEVYTIWDSRVCRFVMGKDGNYNVENVDNFMNYLALCDSLKKDLPEEVHKKFKDNLGDEVSPLRVLETMMFTIGQKS